MKPAEMRKLLALLVKYREFLDRYYVLSGTSEFCSRVEASIERHLEFKKGGE